MASINIRAQNTKAVEPEMCLFKSGTSEESLKGECTANTQSEDC